MGCADKVSAWLGVIQTKFRPGRAVGGGQLGLSRNRFGKREGAGYPEDSGLGVPVVSCRIWNKQAVASTSATLLPGCLFQMRV